jgi:hypothetical protein
MKRIHIYCDGGFANRFNCLVSGLVIANQLGLKPHISWPVNNWCAAPLRTLISLDCDTDQYSISKLRGRVEGLTPLLHDSLGAQTLGVAFNSAYSYRSLDDLFERAVNPSKGIFFYPALIPDWIPTTLIDDMVRSIQLNQSLVETAKCFAEQSLGQPYYGLHLRRTDLCVGYSDDEVRQIVSNHPHAKFFVCSDDPFAERLATAYPNVRCRSKRAYVEKRDANQSWISLTKDDDQRLYYGNIERNADSVIDAVVDLLILSNATILGFSGSTFQSLARLLGRVTPLTNISKPKEFAFTAVSDVRRRLVAGQLTVHDIIDVGQKLIEQKRSTDCIQLFRLALNFLQGNDAFPVLFNLAVALVQEDRPGEAWLPIDSAINIKPDHYQSYLLAAEIGRLNHREDKSLSYLTKGLVVATDLAAKDAVNTIKEKIINMSANLK